MLKLVSLTNSLFKHEDVSASIKFKCTQDTFESALEHDQYDTKWYGIETTFILYLL